MSFADANMNTAILQGVLARYKSGGHFGRAAMPLLTLPFALPLLDDLMI